MADAGVLVFEAFFTPAAGVSWRWRSCLRAEAHSLDFSGRLRYGSASRRDRHSALLEWKESAMSLDERIESLKSKHRALEDAIEKENNRPLPNDLEISTLKKQKLRIKDEIASLASQ
jgi:hypothetical protein